MLSLLISILVILVGLYILIGLLNHLGLAKRYIKTSDRPSVSIMIAARNEESTIAESLLSLENLQYPKELLQVIILNDRSTDQTREIALSYCDRLKHFSLIDIEKDVNGLFGKMNVLSQGIEQASGDIILITDADCRVQPTWVDQMCAYFTDDTSMVGGLTTIESDDPGESDFFIRLQQMDWIFLQAIASGSAGIGLPVSILGNNFGFKRSMYNEMGGFPSIGFSLTEDLALLKNMVSKTRYSLAYNINPLNMVRTVPLKRFSDFFEQRRRWLRGGFKVNIWGWTMMFISFIVHLMISGGLFIFPTNLLFISAVTSILLLDLSLIWRIARRINFGIHLLYFLAYEIFYVVYSVLLVLNLLSKSSIKWKQRTYNGT